MSAPLSGVSGPRATKDDDPETPRRTFEKNVRTSFHSANRVRAGRTARKSSGAERNERTVDCVVARADA